MSNDRDIISIERNIEGIRKDLYDHQLEDKDSFGELRMMQKSITDTLKNHNDKFEEIKLLIQGIAQENKYVNELFRNLTFGKKVFIGMMGLIATIIGILLGIKHLFSQP